MWNLAKCYQVKGRLTDSIEVLKKASKKYAISSGGRHWSVAEVDIGLLYLVLGLNNCKH